MPRPTLEDPERGNDPTDIDHEHSQSTSNKPPPRESNFGDSSEPLFSMYTKVSEEEDNKMVETWQKDADGILIFTGLFSASVAALLAITVPDLRPNSQDTSAFYLGNIYGVLADPNATHTSIPSPDAKPPPFSAPRYAVWVNSLWFLSLVMSVSCALWATSLNQWARRYIRLTQPARCSPEKRARMRAFYANGVDKMHTPWAVEGLPMLLHLSLFLFFGGLAIYLFNVDQEVFTCVVSWIGFFSIVYGSITFLPLIRQDSPYNTPLSIPLGYLFAKISYAAFMVFCFTLLIILYVIALLLACIFSLFLCCDARFAILELRNLWADINRMHRTLHLSDLGRWSVWASGGVDKKAEKAEKRSSEKLSETDGRILGWTISALGDDDSLERFFEAIPGFFDSESVEDLKQHLPYDLLRNALAGFLGRTLSSKSIIYSVKLHRLDIFTDTINLIGEDSIGVPSILETFLSQRWDLAPQTIEVAHTLARWCTSSDQRTVQHARCIVTKVLATVRERDKRWIELAVRITGLPERDLRDIAQTSIARTRNNLLLATLIDLCRQAIHSDEWKLVKSFAEFDIHDTLPRLQHDFCALWNEFVDEARIRGDPHSTPVRTLSLIRHLYITLHQGTDAAPTEFSSADSLDFIWLQPLQYPQCNIAGHHPEPTAHTPSSPSRQFEQASITTSKTTRSRSLSEPKTPRKVAERPRSRSEPTTPREVAESSHQAPITTLPILPSHTSAYPTHASLASTVAALQDIPLAAMPSHLLEGTAQQDIVASFGESPIGKVLSTASMPAAPTSTLVPVPAASTPHKSSASSDVEAAFASNPILPQPASSDVGFSIPASPPSSRDTLFPNAESLVIFSGTAPFHVTGNATQPRLRARGLVNSGNICFVNAVLQLLVRTPRFWNLLKELGDLKEQRGARDLETGGGGATPLADATVRFFDESMIKEEPPAAQQQPQQTSGRKPGEDEDAKKVDSFEPIYMYDAMKEKIQLKSLLNGQQQDAEEFFRLYLDTLDEELLALLASVNEHNSATATSGVEEREVESVESPLMQIFGGKFRSTVRAPNQPENVTIEDWRLIHLDIQHKSVHAVEDALVSILHPKPVQLGPFGSSEASQLVEKLPPVLVLHLKRFLYDVTTDGIVKIKKPVQFAPELEIPLEIMVPIDGKSAEPARYKLYGVLYHHGDTAGSGHYTADVLHQTEGGGSVESWVRIDDEVVTAARHEDVFGGQDNGRVDDRCAYMLFYCRVART